MPEPSVRTTRRFPSSASSSPGNCGQRAHIAEPSRLEKLPAPSRARVCERLSPALPFSFRTALRSPVPFGSLRTALCRVSRFGPCCTVRYRVVPSGVFAPRRIAASGSLRSVAVLCSVVPFKRSVPVPGIQQVQPIAPRRVMPFGSLRTALCRVSRFGPCCTVRYRVVPSGVFAPRRIAASGSLRSVAVLCSVVPFKRSVLVPNHPVLPRSRRAGVQGMAYRGDGKSAPQPLSSPTGTAGRTVPMNRSRSLRPRSDRIRSETRGGSRSDAGDGSGECRKQQGAPWKAAPPSSRS